MQNENYDIDVLNGGSTLDWQRETLRREILSFLFFLLILEIHTLTQTGVYIYIYIYI